MSCRRCKAKLRGGVRGFTRIEAIHFGFVIREDPCKSVAASPRQLRRGLRGFTRTEAIHFGFVIREDPCKSVASF